MFTGLFLWFTSLLGQEEQDTMNHEEHSEVAFKSTDAFS